jgi:hypothetical protein
MNFMKDFAEAFNRVADQTIAMMNAEIAAGHKRILLTPEQALAVARVFEDLKRNQHDMVESE